MISKRQVKIGCTYKTKAWWCENGHITITDIQDDIAEVVYDKVDLNGKLIKRRCIGHLPIKQLRGITINRIKFRLGEAINDN